MKKASQIIVSNAHVAKFRADRHAAVRSGYTEFEAERFALAAFLVACVPDEDCDHPEDEHAAGERHGFNRCIATVLKAAQ